MQHSMVGHSRGEGRGRPNGRACYHTEYPPNEDPQDGLEPPYYVQDLNKQRSIDDVKKMPEDYRHVGPAEPLYHQPPTALETQDRVSGLLYRFQGGCVAGEVPGMVATGGNSLASSPYFAQHQLRMSQSGGRRFSPLRLHLDASKSSWRRCSWRCTTVVFVCVTLCLAATTTFFATSQVSRWHSADDCLEDAVDTPSVNSPPEDILPPPGQPAPPPGNPDPHLASPDGWSSHTPARPSPILAPPAVYPEGRRGQPRPRGGPRPVFPAPPPTHAALPLSKHDSVFSSVNVKLRLFFHKIKDNLHAFLWPVIDVSQELSAGRPQPASATAADDRSSLAASPSLEENNELNSVPVYEHQTTEKPLLQLATLAYHQEDVSLLGNKHDLVNTRWKRPTAATHGRIVSRHARSVPEPQPSADPLLPSPSSAPLNHSLSTASSPPGHASTPPGTPSYPPREIQTQPPPSAGAEVLSGASSAVVVNNPGTLGAAAARSHHSQATNVAGTSHSLITPAAVTPAAPPSDPAALPGDPSRPPPPLERQNNTAEERQDGVLASHTGAAPPDHATPSTRDVTQPRGDATLPAHVYQVTPETVAAPQAPPSLSGGVTGAASQHPPPALYSSPHPEPLGAPTRPLPYGTPLLQNLLRDSTSDEKVNLLSSDTAEIGKASLGSQGSQRPPEEAGLLTPRTTLLSASLPSALQWSASAPTTELPAVSSSESFRVNDTLETLRDFSYSSPAASYATAAVTAAALVAPTTTTTVLITSAPPTTTPAAVTKTSVAREADLTKPLSDEAVKPSHFGANYTNITDSRANHNEDSVMPIPQVVRVISHKADPLHEEKLARKREDQEASRFKEEEIREGGGGGEQDSKDSSERRREGNEPLPEGGVARDLNNASHHPEESPSSPSHTGDPGRPPNTRDDINNMSSKWRDGTSSSSQHPAGDGNAPGDLPSHLAQEIVQRNEENEEALSFPVREGRQALASPDEEIVGSHVAREAERQNNSDALSEDSSPSTPSMRQGEAEEGGGDPDAGIHHALVEMSEQEALSLPKIELSEHDRRQLGENTGVRKNEFDDGRPNHNAREAGEAGGWGASGTQQTTNHGKSVIDLSLGSVSSHDLGDEMTRSPQATPNLSINTSTPGSGNTPAHMLTEEEKRHGSTQKTPEGLLAKEDQISMKSTSRGEYNVGDDGEGSEDPRSPAYAPTAAPHDAAEAKDPTAAAEAFSIDLHSQTNTSGSLSSEASRDAFNSGHTPTRGSANGDEALYRGATPDSSGPSEVNIDHGVRSLDASRPRGDQSPQLPGNAPRSEGPAVMLTGIAAQDPMRHMDPHTLPGAAPSSPPSLEEGGAGGGLEELVNNPIEGSEELTPRTDIDTPPDGQVSNGNSYVGVGGSLALAVVGAPSQTPPHVLGDQADAGISRGDGIGINDVAAKDQRDKATHEIPLSPRNQTGKIAAKSLAQPATLTGRIESTLQKSIESEKKQSAPKSEETSARPGYSGRKESSIDTQGYEANQGHSFLSRSNQIVDDPNQKSVHAQVSSEDAARENREDQDAYLSGCDDRDGDAEGDRACPGDQHHHRHASEEALTHGTTGGGESPAENNRHHEDVVRESNPRHEAIEEDERDFEGIPEGSVDRALEGSLLAEHPDTPDVPLPAHTHEAPLRELPAGEGGEGGPHPTHPSSRPVQSGGSSSNNSPLGSSGNSSHGGEAGGSGHSIMPYRDPWQSQDSPCKCSCQCDGGATPSIMPGRVVANLNSQTGAGAPPDPSPPPPQHRHRHHHQGHRREHHGPPPPLLPSHPLPPSTTTSPQQYNTPTPPLDSPVSARYMEQEVSDSGEEQTTSTTSTTSGDGTAVRQLKYTAVRNPAVTHVVPEPSMSRPGPATPTPTLSDGNATDIANVSATTTFIHRGRENATIHASLVLSDDDEGSQRQARPQQVAPPDGSSFSPLALGQELAFNLTPYGYWNLHLTLNDPTDIRITLTKPRGTSLGLYARRSSLPTHTQHDIMKILREARQRDVRASPNMVEVSVEQVLEEGEWFISIYNDDGDPHQVALIINRGNGGGECPQRCNDRGHCILGRCQCHAGYSGVDCSQMLCPILCSGHGDYVSGHCRCHAGYKGKECQLLHHECEVPDCSGKGQCVAGRCRCAKGFTGEFCQTVDCAHPTCSGHGWCVNGTCVCQKGWRGPDCAETDLDARQCLPDCNDHGTFDIELHTCVCHHPWTGSDCSKKSCSLDCGQHGVCENDACTCDEGWKGDNCSEKLCDPRCSEHGQCKNGTCVCMTGWNGRHCTLSGCPGNCRDRGTCDAAGTDGTWFCSCQTGWDGPDCSAMLETRCNDGKDNDYDGLVDCQDPECCDHKECNGSQLCVSRASSPIDLLLRKQPPAATASFFEKMKFLIEDDSLQHFTNSDAYNKRRAAVVRGRVVTWAGKGVIGLRVSTSEDREGFTLTRNDGMFDLMVNGGGAVALQFGKPPFTPKTVVVMVPWNEVVVLDDIVMTVSGSNRHSGRYRDSPSRRPTSHCPLHDYDLLRPIIMATWQNVFQGECPHEDAILVESQAVQESIQIPGTDVYLVYHSSRANGYESTIRMQLTPDHIPATLRRIHLRIVLEGTLFTRVFEADPNIKFTYAWNRYNVYKQRVHGVTVARVSVGYEHASCPEIIWEHQTTRVAGNDLLISMVGGFNLHVHHTYNYHQGILQKGDGQNIYLAGQRRLVTTLLGTGEQREVLCGDRCEGRANQVPLLTPSCLAAAPDGSLFVGDFTLIHRVKPDGTVSTVAVLNETRVSYHYHMAVSPLDGSVYVSDPEAHQVLRLGATKDDSPVVVAGSGQRCLPGDKDRCGDGKAATLARLTYPKGLAVSADGDIYIADGTNIRVAKYGGSIHTIIGGHDHRSHWVPVPCNGTINMDQLNLRWPTELAISPLDGSLHILDDHLVLRVTPDHRVQVVSGRSLNCPTPPNNPPDMSRTALLLNPQSIAFSPEGELYVAESDRQRINRVRIITSDGRISTFAGADSDCNCRDPTCYCHTYDNMSAASAIFFSISSIAVTPDGVLHISDQAGYRVRSVRTMLPELKDRKHYEIISPDSHEVYVFNRLGQHTETRNLITGQTIYKFLYNSHSSAGRLWSVSDGDGNKFHIIRERGGSVNAIENPQKQRIKIHLTMTEKLEQLVAPNGYNISFTYNSLRSSGLISSKIEADGRSYNYDYDEQGRLTRAVLPTGQVIQLTFDLSARGAEVVVTRDGKNPVKTRVRGNTLTHTSGPMVAVADMGGEGQLRVLTDWGHKVSLERTSYRVLESTSQIAAEMFPILSRQQTHISGKPINRYEWIYSPASRHNTGHGMKVSSTLKVNDANLLKLSYDPASSSEALLSTSGQMLVNITYDSMGRPVLWVPVQPLVPSNVSYDHWGHIIGWRRGNLSEQYEYDNLMRLKSVTYADGATVMYDYKEKMIKPLKVTHPSGRSYGLVYDDAGSLRQVVTPRGSAYTLHVSTSLGFYRLRLALPEDNIALQIRLDEQGRLLAMTQPGRGGTLLYQYDDLGKVSAELYGRGYTQYTYDDKSLIHTAKTKHNHIDVRTDYRYLTGLFKDMRLRYGSKSDLHNVRLKFSYDGSARLRRIEGEINSNPLKEVIIRFDNQTGVLNLISDLRIIRNNILETMLQNPNKDFVNTRRQDHYGRLAEVDMTLQGRTVFMMKLKYDNRNRISERLIEVAGRREGLNITYMPDGEILKVTGTLRWVYAYDENGNIVMNSYSEPLTYDECDRVTKVGGNDVVYDDRGFVVSIDNQNFEYNTKGLLVSGWNREEKWSFTLGYDHLDRISVYRDRQNNATQIIYGRPDLPDLITHLHNPHTGATTHLLYDDMNHVIAMDQPDGRYYVATDQNGTPIAIFDNLGSQISSQVWTPFGLLIDYSGSSLSVGVGPWGRFREPQTGLVIFGGHAYHPRILQWMTPRWSHLTNPKRLVTDVFVYRFMNNNPFVSPPGSPSHYYTDVSEWLDLYGIRIDRVLGSEYYKKTVVVPRPVVSVDNLGTSEVVSGLWCQYQAGIKHLHDLSFFSHSNIQHRMGTWMDVPISRQVSIFGPGVLVSDIDGRVLVTKIGDGDFAGVVGDVIRTVLNNSIILDVSATHNGLDTFYFIKGSRNHATEDMNHLGRLSGVFNVTRSETEHGHEIRMSTPTANLVIMYGERVHRARSRVLDGLQQEAELRAWEREATLVRMGRVGSHAWSAVEAAELEREGRVPGYVATHFHSPSRYPLLASDATNIVFKHESSRKRRKSRRKGRKKSWRQRKKVGV